MNGVEPKATVLPGGTIQLPSGNPMLEHTQSADLEVLGPQLNVEAHQETAKLVVDERRVRRKRLTDGEFDNVPAGHRIVTLIQANRESFSVSFFFRDNRDHNAIGRSWENVMARGRSFEIINYESPLTLTLSPTGERGQAGSLSPTGKKDPPREKGDMPCPAPPERVGGKMFCLFLPE